MSTGPELIRPAETRERSWLPLGVAALAVVVVAAAIVLILERGKSQPSVASATAAADAYAAQLPISNVAMSESSNLAGGKVTYVDGHIANTGSRTITGITVQVLFRNPAHEVAQNETQSMMFIRARDPYIDTQTIASAPLKPGQERDFRLSFDAVSPNWDGVYPEIRILRVQSQ